MSCGWLAVLFLAGVEVGLLLARWMVAKALEEVAHKYGLTPKKGGGCGSQTG